MPSLSLNAVVPFTPAKVGPGNAGTETGASYRTTATPTATVRTPLIEASQRHRSLDSKVWTRWLSLSATAAPSPSTSPFGSSDGGHGPSTDRVLEVFRDGERD